MVGLEVLAMYGGAMYAGAATVLLVMLKTDVINMVKLKLGASKGAKLFRIHKKDNTTEEFVEICKPGGVIKHDGDVYAILRGTVATNRAKNAPEVTLVEGNLNSIDPFDEVDDRVDTKQLRALFFAEREKAKSDLNPDVKLLKLLVIGALIACGIAVVISFFNYQGIEKMVAQLAPIAQYYTAITAKGTVML
jgi:hypothetical protein